MDASDAIKWIFVVGVGVLVFALVIAVSITMIRGAFRDDGRK